MLVLMASWLPEARLDVRNYQFVEMFAGEAQVSRVFREDKKSVASLDLAYDAVVAKKGGMDLSTSAGFLLLCCNHKN